MNDYCYVDNAATTFPKPDAVHRAVDDASRRFAVNPGRSGSDLAVEAGAIIDGLRHDLHALLNAPGDDPSRVVFGANATDALNTAILGMGGGGGHVVSTRLEHNSVLRPLRELERMGVITLTLVPFDGDGYVDPDAVAAALRPDTRLAVLTHASNVLGTVQDVAAVSARCRERDVPVLLDAAQSAGSIPVDMAALGVDLMAFTGHKGLLGPMGTGGLIVAPGVDVEPSRWGGTGVRSAEPLHLRDYPWRLETGTPNLPGLAGLRAGVAWLRERGVESVAAHEAALLERFRSAIRDLDGVRILCDGSGPRVAVASVLVEGMSSEEAGMRLDVDHDVIVRTGLQCAPLVHEDLDTVDRRGTVRFSFGPLNTDEDVDRAVAGLADCAAARR